MSHQTYTSIQSIHSSSPSFEPPIPIYSLGPISLTMLVGFFVLAFIFTTLPKSKNPLPELSTALIASLFAGGGVIALFCTLGVYV